MITDEGQAVTVAEAARILGVTTARLYQMADSGDLAMVDTKPRQITAEELERVVMERTGGYRPLGERLRNRLRMDVPSQAPTT